MTDEQPHLRCWPYHSAPPAYRHDDNGGDEDWVIHIPVALLNHRRLPTATERCIDHPGRLDPYDCIRCDQLYELLLPVHGPPFPLDTLAISDYAVYLTDDGAVVITSHA